MCLILTAEEAEGQIGDVDKQIDKQRETDRQTNKPTERLGRGMRVRERTYKHELLLRQLWQCSTTMQVIVIIINSYRTHASYVYILIIIT